MAYSTPPSIRIFSGGAVVEVGVRVPDALLSLAARRPVYRWVWAVTEARKKQKAQQGETK